MFKVECRDESRGICDSKTLRKLDYASDEELQRMVDSTDSIGDTSRAVENEAADETLDLRRRGREWLAQERVFALIRERAGR